MGLIAARRKPVQNVQAVQPFHSVQGVTGEMPFPMVIEPGGGSSFNYRRLPYY
jgi:hypothetical protein